MAERRRQEIEEKRARLEELRRLRDERAARLQGDRTQQIPPPAAVRGDVADLVDSLLAAPRSSSSLASASRDRSPQSSPIPTSLRETATSPIVINEPKATHRELPSETVAPTNLEVGADSARNSVNGAVSTEVLQAPAARPVEEVQVQTSVQQPVAKPPPITYSKAIQTESVSTGTDTGDLEAGHDPRSSPSGSGAETADEMRRRILQELEAERRSVEDDLKRLRDQEHIKELSPSQKQAIYTTPDFSAFIEQSTKIAQRALNDDYDYVKDYTIGVDDSAEEPEHSRLKLHCAFTEERWTAGRSITGIDWSHKFPELVAASYNKNTSSHNDPDGLVAIWNMHLLGRPEFVFHSPSDVLSVTFSPFHPNMVFGGTYSGQVLAWDTRAKHLPVLKTPLSANGHTYPIYSMKTVGTQNANTLMTASTDGLVCNWQTDMLAQPQESLQLSLPSHHKTDEVSIMCLDCSPGDPSMFVVGTEEGSVYRAHHHDRAGVKAGLDIEVVDRHHSGPVTSLDIHPSTGSIDFSDLFLTTSVDWTIKLWRNQTIDKQSGHNMPTRALHSFEGADDYVFDARWHPQHPAVFGSVDGTGRFNLWNLNKDTEVPLVSTQVSPRALNRMAWDRSTTLSRKVGLGGADGRLYVYSVAEPLVSARDAEWLDLQRTLAGFNESTASS